MPNRRFQRAATVAVYVTVVVGGVIGLSVGLSALPLLTAILISVAVAAVGTGIASLLVGAVTTSKLRLPPPWVPLMLVLAAWTNAIAFWSPGLYTAVCGVMVLAYVLRAVAKYLPEPPRLPGSPAIEHIP